jgi:hypothetical protein
MDLFVVPTIGFDLLYVLVIVRLGATHLAPDARPTETRHRITIPTLRGAFIQRLFGSQRALVTM